jgi:hypothetical protein
MNRDGNMKGILIIFFISIILAATLFLILYALTETSWGDWIANLVIYPRLSNRTARDLIYGVYSYIHF